MEKNIKIHIIHRPIDKKLLFLIPSINLPDKKIII
jgi:hypothetical protein